MKAEIEKILAEPTASVPDAGIAEGARSRPERKGFMEAGLECRTFGLQDPHLEFPRRWLSLEQQSFFVVLYHFPGLFRRRAVGRTVRIAIPFASEPAPDVRPARDMNILSL